MKKRFKKAYLEIINQCNLNCSFCPKTRRTPARMTEAQVRAALTELRDYTDYVYLHVMGEPLMHPQLPEILKECESMGLRATVTTNGVLLPARGQILLDAPKLYKVQISLHSFEANEQKFTLREYLEGIWNFAEAFSRKETGICVLRLWNQDGQNRLNHEILSFLHEKKHAEGTAEDWNRSLLNFQDIRLFDRIFLQSAEKFEWPDLGHTGQNEQVFCWGLRNQVAVLADGTVVPCCLDHEGDIPLGNIFREHLGDILDSPRAKALYDGFSRRQAVEELCRKCPYAQRF